MSTNTNSEDDSVETKTPVLRWISNRDLDDALNSPITTMRLPPRSFRPHTTPAFFDSLTRSTMPTASLSPPPHITSHKIPQIQRSSLDSLRLFTTADSPLVTNKQNHHLAPKNPLVFCHGLLGFDSVTIGSSLGIPSLQLQVAHWRGLKQVLSQSGSDILITRVPATSSPIDRAKVLLNQIESTYPGKKVHLIGHSMGGLDCRYLTTHLNHQSSFQILSVTTIATPHRGSSFADHFLHDLVGKDRLPQVLFLLDLLPNGGGDGKAFEFLTRESMKSFNEQTPNLKGVKYFSWGAVYDPGLIDTWKYPHSIILEQEGPNDGLVSVESAKWGTYLGTLSDVNHLDLVGWINTARYKWAEIMGKQINFNPDEFYLGIADMLAREVEGLEDPEAEQEPGTPGDGEVREAESEGEGEDQAEESKKETAEREQMIQSLDRVGADIITT